MRRDRLGDARALAKIEDAQSRLCAEAEREVLWVLNGHCNSPIAGHATLAGGEMTLTAAVLDEAGDRFIEVSRQGAADRPRELGRAVGSGVAGQGRGRDHRADTAGRTLGRVPIIEIDCYSMSDARRQRTKFRIAAK